MLHTQLDEATRTQLHALCHADLSQTARDRLEIVLLSAAGWSAPRIAVHLGCHPHTARKALRLFQQQGIAGFHRRRPGPPPDLARRDRINALLTELLGQERTWTAAQLAAALSPHGFVLGTRQVRRYLKLLKAGYHRTASTLKHKQDPIKVERAKVVLENVKKSGGRPAEAVLLGRKRLQPVVAVGLQLVPAGPAKAGALRVSARPPCQCAGGL